MTHITRDGTLSLTGYKLNTGVCEALSTFFAQNKESKSPFLVKSLILFDNCMQD